ncbi:ferrous iron transport protein A [bacterium]|nr:MAG: ferrous iron transport protein A [bacterium]
MVIENKDLKSDSKPRTVAEMGCGECATICKLSGEHLGQNSPCIKLLELGFTPGQLVTIIAKSPFQDPVAVCVRGTVIALRKQEAECIQV